MDITYLKQKVEFLSDLVHRAWMTEKTKQGFHPPELCPEFDSSDDKRTASGRFTKHCVKCHTDLYPYDELPEHVKEYDRVTVSAVLSAMEQL